MKYLISLISLLAILANTTAYAQRDTLKYDEIERYLDLPGSWTYFGSDSVSRAYYYCVQMSPAQKCSIIAVQLRYGLINNSRRNDTLEIAVFDAEVTDKPKLPCVGSYKHPLGNESIPPGNSQNLPGSDTLTFWLPKPIIVSPRRDFIIGYKPIVSGGDIFLHYGIHNSSAAWRSRRYWYEADKLEAVTAQDSSGWCYCVRAIVEYNPSLADAVKSVRVPSDKALGGFFLYQNYPNPFNPHTVVTYQIPNAGNVTLLVYDVLGRKVTTLVDGFQEAGTHQVVFNSRQLFPHFPLASGVYYYRLGMGELVQIRKMAVTH